MPPSQSELEGVHPESYHFTQRMIQNGISLGKKGLNTVKPYTPTRVQTILEQTGDRMTQTVEPYTERATELVSALDARLDSVVIYPAVSGFQEASKKADHIMSSTESRIETVRQGVDSVRHQMGFVGSSITEACASKDEEEDEESVASSTLLERAQGRVSTLSTIVKTKYYKVLADVDGEIEVYFPTGEEQDEAAKTPVALCSKAARRIKHNSVQRLRESKMRTQEQLQKLVHVDLISYCADVIDTTAATTYEVAVSKPLALKAQVKANVSEKAEKAVEAVQTTKTKLYEKVQPVLAKLYSEKLAEAYRVALQKAGEKRDTVILLVKSTKEFAYNKIVLVYNDGVTGLVLELRSEGFLPVDGDATISKALDAARAVPPAVRAKAEALTAELMALMKSSPELARAKLAELYTMLVAQKDYALSGVMYTDAVEFAQAKADKLVELSTTQYELAEQKVQELYAWFLSLSPEAQEKLQSLLEASKALPSKAQETALALPDLARAKFPVAAEHVEAKWALLAGKVALAKEHVEAKWALLAGKVVEAKEYLTVEKAVVALEDVKTLVKAKLNVEERWAALKTLALENASVQQLQEKAVPLVATVKSKATEIWQKILARLYPAEEAQAEKEEVIEEKAATTPGKYDPIDNAFEAYCEANGIDEEDEDEHNGLGKLSQTS